MPNTINQKPKSYIQVVGENLSKFNVFGVFDSETFITDAEVFG